MSPRSVVVWQPALFQFARFVSIGVLNTGIGLAVIFAGQWLLGFGPYVANAVGYTVGLMVSFILNGRLTFRTSRFSSGMFLRFLAVTAVAYACNLAIVSRLLPSGAARAQLAGAAVYALVGFIGCRRFVFI